MNKVELKSLSIPEELSYSTVKIYCEGEEGDSIGTGFIFDFCKTSGLVTPALITNRHVVENASFISLKFTFAKRDGSPDIGNGEGFRISDAGKCCYFHPDQSVDLALIPLGSIIDDAAKAGKPYYYKCIQRSLIPSEGEMRSITALENIVMVGYPIGLEDVHNMMPIFRKGILATHPYLDYNGRKEFMVDMSCFPGSSGSPIFLYDKGLKVGKGLSGGGPVLRFLGVLYAGPQHTVTGDIEIVEVATESKLEANSDIPMNLGVAIKAEKILDFDDLVNSKKV